MRKIIYYKKENGREPVKEFIDSLTDKEITKIFWVFNLIEDVKHLSLLPTEYFKNLNSDIWEIRVKFARNSFRVLCFFDSGKIIIATNGFKKKTQKTPLKEIKLAEQRMKEYFKERKEQ